MKYLNVLIYLPLKMSSLLSGAAPPDFNNSVCMRRFGVIHAVFTNLLLWGNGVMSEAEHFLNNHKRRLSAMGYANLSIGKGQGVDW